MKRTACSPALSGALAAAALWIAAAPTPARADLLSDPPPPPKTTGHAAPPFQVYPGQGIGDVRLGERLDALERRGFGPVAGSAATVRRGPLTAVLSREGQVTAVIYDLGKDLGKAPPCVAITGVPPCSSGPLTQVGLAERIGACGPLQHNEGGTMIDCAGGLSLGESLAGLDIRVTAPTPPPATRCDVYAERSAAREFPVLPGKTYCVGASAYTSASPLVKPQDRVCEVVKGKSEAVLRCRELHLIFTPDQKRLVRILYAGR